MFENFPYTDMHQLNLDWIIKIAKDFLDQYTHLQQLISDGEASLQNLTNEGVQTLVTKTEQLETLLNEWYRTHSEDIANQLADALEDLNDWYTEHSADLNEQLQDSILEFNRLADQKAADTIESIPSDYSTVANDVLHLKNDSIASHKMGYFSEIEHTNSLLPITLPHTVVNGVDIYIDENGALHCKGTCTDPIINYRVSEITNTDNVNVYMHIHSDIIGGEAIIALYDGSTHYGSCSINNYKGDRYSIATYSGTAKDLYIYLYIAQGAVVDYTISFNTTTYKNQFVAPYSKIIDNHIPLHDGSVAFYGGDGNFVFDTKMDITRFFSMPFIMNFSELNINYDTGIVDFDNAYVTSPVGYHVLNQTVNYTVDGYVKWFVYNKDTQTVEVKDTTYEGPGEYLFGIYQKRIISPYGYLYNYTTQFPATILDPSTFYIDTTNNTITFTNVYIAYYNRYVILNNTYSFNYNRDQAITFYIENGTVKAVYTTATTNLSNISILYQHKNIVLFTLFQEKVYGLANYIKVFLDDKLIHGSIDSLDNQLPFKKIGFLGDSITAGVGAGGATGAYPRWVRDKLTCAVTNVGLSGSAITVTSQQTVEGFITRVSDIPADCDIVAFMGGTNDYWQNVPLGQMGDNTNTTFYGALSLLCQALQNRFPTAFIFAMTPPMGYQPDNNFDMETKTQIGSFLDVANAIKEVCAKYAIPVIDLMHDSSLNPKNSGTKTDFYSDGVHLNETGEKALASEIIGFLRNHYRMTW